MKTKTDGVMQSNLAMVFTIKLLVIVSVGSCSNYFQQTHQY